MVHLAGFFFAVVLGYFAPSLQVLLISSCVLLTVGGALYASRQRFALRTMLGFTLGLLYITFFALSFQLNKFPEPLWQQKIPVNFIIVSEPVYESYRTSFIAEITDLERQVRLSWYVPPKHLKKGQSWDATVKLKPIHAYANPGGFDYERLNMQQRISAQGYIDNKKPFKLNGIVTPEKPTAQLRHKIKGQLQATLGEHAAAPLLLALAIGDRQDLTDTHWEILRVTGTAHLMAISGLHVGLVFGVFFLLTTPLFRLVSMYFHGLPAKFSGAVMAAALTGFYVLLSGMAVSTIRAYIMLCFVCVFLCSYRRLNIFYSLSLTACLFLLIDPVVAMQAGFILSFATVSLIACLVQGQFVQGNKIRVGVGLQWRLAVLIIPLTLATLNTIALITPIANMVAIPWVSFTVVPLLLFYDVAVLLDLPYAEMLLYLAAYAMQGLWWFLERLSVVAFTPNVIVSQPWQWFAWAALFVAPRAYLPIFLLLVLFPWVEKPKEGELWLTLLDVGQGLATVLQTQNHTLLYDAGPLKGGTVLLQYLRSQHIKKIDTLIISHADADHRVGAEQLVDCLPVGEIRVGEFVTQLPAQSFCQQGQRWEWDSVLFEMLHPDNNPKWKGNNRSCVLQVKVNSQVLLLTGDIQKPVETHLLNTIYVTLASDLIIAPHHGSKTSSSRAFVEAVMPSYALIPAGFLSQYGHPHENVMANYEAVGAALYNTAHQGAIHVKITGKGIQVNAYRGRYKRWWQ